MVGKKIISVERLNAVVALMDFDYPQNHEIALTTLYYRFSFQDTRIPRDILHPFNSVLDEYNAYTSSG